MRSLKARLALLVAVAVGAFMGIAVAAGAAPNGAWNFVSAPNLHPPRIHTDQPTKFKQLGSGLIFIANFRNVQKPQPIVGQGGPLILNSHMQPVWFKPINPNLLALDLKLQTYNGKPALSWWQGVISPVGVNDNGTDVVVNQHYRQVASVTGQQGWNLSPHELVISGHFGWVTSYKPIQTNQSPSGTLLDSAVQEYNLNNGQLVYNWDAFQHIPLSQSQSPAPTVPGAGWDAYHVNSVQLQPGGKFLTSMRNTWGAYLVDIKTGAIQWTVSSNPKITSSFKVPANGAFQWQHDAEMHSGNVLSVFDDGCCANPAKPAPDGPTRGLELKLNTSNHTASLVHQYTRPSTVAGFLGNTDQLPNGNVMVGWGSASVNGSGGIFTEFGKGGSMLLDAVMPSPDLTYRAFVHNWVGTPFFPPSGAVRHKNGKTTVYASWDGATQVASWRVLAGPGVKHLTAVAVKGKTGFETPILLGGKSYKVYKVQALNARGKVLGTSGAFPKQNSGSSSPGFY